MYEYYYIFRQKIGTKSLKSTKPVTIIAKDGVVVNYCENAGMSVKMAVAKKVLELQESGLYCRVAVMPDIKGKKLYDWRMDMGG